MTQSSASQDTHATSGGAKWRYYSCAFQKSGLNGKVLLLRKPVEVLSLVYHTVSHMEQMQKKVAQNGTYWLFTAKKNNKKEIFLSEQHPCEKQGGDIKDYQKKKCFSNNITSCFLCHKCFYPRNV